MNKHIEEMTQGYEVKPLLKALEAEGLVVLKEGVLDAVEETADKAIPTVFNWLNKSAELTPTKIDDGLSLGYDFLEKKALEYAKSGIQKLKD